MSLCLQILWRKLKQIVRSWMLFWSQEDCITYESKDLIYFDMFNIRAYVLRGADFVIFRQERMCWRERYSWYFDIIKYLICIFISKVPLKYIFSSQFQENVRVYPYFATRDVVDQCMGYTGCRTGTRLLSTDGLSVVNMLR